MSNLLDQKPRQKEPKPLRDKKHLRWVTTLPCCVCHATPCDAAHIRIAWHRMAQKPPDNLVVPLCRPCHTEQHQGEVKYWEKLGLDPFELAGQLWESWRMAFYDHGIKQAISFNEQGER